MGVIIVDEGVKRVANNKKLYQRLLKSFSGRKLVNQIIEGMDNSDNEAAVSACHALRGTAANLAMPDLAAAAGDVEDAVKAGNPTDVLIAKLLGSMEAVEKAIEEILKE